MNNTDIIVIPKIKLLRKELKQLQKKFFEFPSDTLRMAELKQEIKQIRKVSTVTK